MLKLRTMLLSVIAAVILISLSAATANAQLQPNDQERRFWTNNPCSDALISEILWDEKGRTGVDPHRYPPAGGADCNASNYAHYGRWTSYDQLWGDLQLYRYQQNMNASGISLAGSFVGKGDGNQYLVFSKGNAFTAINVGRVVGTGGSSIISHDGGTLVNTNGSNVVAQGGGNFVPLATVVAQGGGNLLSSDSAGVVAQGGGNVVAQGGGNLRQILAVGDTGFQFPNRYVVTSGPRQQASTPPATPPGVRPNPSDTEVAQWRQRGPCSDPWVSKAVTEVKGRVDGYAYQGDCRTTLYNNGSWSNYDQLYRYVAAVFSSHPAPPSAPPRSDDAILMCLSGTVNQIRGRDSGANHVSLTVSGGTAYFTGNVVSQSYKDQLSTAATSCGARAVSNNLRIGR